MLEVDIFSRPVVRVCACVLPTCFVLQYVRLFRVSPALPGVLQYLTSTNLGGGSLLLRVLVLFTELYFFYS